MNFSTQKTLLWLTAATAGAGAVLALVFAWTPLDRADLPPPAKAAASRPSSVEALPPLEEFADAWNMELRRPLMPTPTVSRPLVVQRPVAQTAPPVRLVGVVGDSRGRRGLFLSSSGRVLLRSSGETIDGVSVVRVDERGAALSIGGQTVAVSIESPPATQPAKGASAVAFSAAPSPSPTTAPAAAPMKLVLPPHILRGINLQQEP